MAETPAGKLWIGRATFLAVAFAIIFAQLLPIDVRPDTWPFPDLLLAVTFVWVVRRPDYAPVLIIGAIFLLTDLLFQRPPGLWAALVVIATEIVRTRSRGLRDFPLLLECLTVAGAIVALVVANRLVLSLALTPQAPLGPTLIQMLGTIAIYPIVIPIARFVFGVTRPALGEVDTYGHRI